MSLDVEFLSLELRDRLALGEGLRHRLAIEAVQFRFVIKKFQL